MSTPGPQAPPSRRTRWSCRSSSRDGSEPAGLLVAGVNPYRALDDDYRASSTWWPTRSPPGWPTRRAYEAERQRAEALAELDRAKTDFFSNVSHEFRTPLTLIMGPLAELRGSPALAADARSREELEVIERNALRLGKLVNTLLDFSRLAGRPDRGALRAASTWPRPPRSWPASSARRWSGPGLDFEVDCRRPGRAGLRRPRHVGEGRPQPAVQRGQVHLRGRHHRRPAPGTSGAAVLTVARHRHRGARRGAAPPVRALPPGRAGPRRAPARAAGSAWPWCASWSGCTAARSTAESEPGRGHHVHGHAPARLGAPAAEQVASADGGGRPVACRRPPSRSSPRRCAGCPAVPTAEQAPAPPVGGRPSHAGPGARRRRQRRHARVPAPRLLARATPSRW